MTVRIAMWSGPRNLSTAMMYAFAARGDCAVSDEPFYAAYLALTGLEHPMREQILASQPQDPEKVVLTGDAPDAAPIWYQKHMTHHMVPGIPLDWMSRCRHAFLIRHPSRVVASYVRKREAPVLEDLGFTQQRALFERLVQTTGEIPPVLDSTALRAAPREKLIALCAALQIPWTERMLYWSKGSKPYDGVWAAHWYQAVHDSTGFDAAEGPLPDLPPEYARLAEAALPAYEALAQYAL
ncbi:HAD family hydrolase [Pararhodobacter zhoushanensis]|uniref:HAD family hydrolase n=1 Tax=Pararhodobacter zhoushanensis TaxID=2479545 RepID=A0ABT3H4D1_9RHOB|nr:HAD family hydrolase [Pararhodobacter zhoushanensis]MCW1934622.1 HAD family hydrolase [Pararhodobacter zhoushanensis]